MLKPKVDSTAKTTLLAEEHRYGAKILAEAVYAAANQFRTIFLQ